MNTSAAGETVVYTAASESVLSKPGSETLSFFKNHWGWFLLGGAVIACLLAYWFWPSNSEASGSNSKFDPKIPLGRKVEKSELKEETLEDILKDLSGEKFSKWRTACEKISQGEMTYKFSSKKRESNGIRYELFRLKVNKSERKATFSNSNGKEICTINYLGEEEGIKKLRDLSERMLAFLTVFDKVVDLCAKKKIDPKVEVDGYDMVRTFTFDLGSAAFQGFSLKLDGIYAWGWTLEKIIIKDTGKIRLVYVENEDRKQEFPFNYNFFDFGSEMCYRLKEAVLSESSGWKETKIGIKEVEDKNKGYGSNFDND